MQPNLLVILLGTAVLSLCICGGTAVFFLMREKKRTGQILRMLDQASDGSFREIHLNESSISLMENSLWKYLCARQAGEKALRQEKERIQADISDLSHQSAAPVSNILLYSQLLEEWLEERDVSEDEKREALEYLEAVKEQTHALDFLIEGLGRLSRMETGIIHVERKEQELEPLFRSLERQFSLKAREKGVRLTLTETDARAVFDMKWTVEAAANLVDNALKYTPAEGEVKISAETYSFFVRIRVQDDGIGIAEEEQPRIFGRFYRSPSLSQEPGLGIGLYIAREIVKQQKGYIKVESAKGKGSIFSVFLPVNE